MKSQKNKLKSAKTIREKQEQVSKNKLSKTGKKKQNNSNLKVQSQDKKES